MKNEEMMKDGITKFLNLFGLELSTNSKQWNESIFEIKRNEKTVGILKIFDNQGKVYAKYEDVELLATYKNLSWRKDIIEFDITNKYNGSVEVIDRNHFVEKKCDIQLVKPIIKFAEKDNYYVKVIIQQGGSIFRILLDDKVKNINEDINITVGMYGMSHRIVGNENEDVETFMTSAIYVEKDKMISVYDGNEDKVTTYEVDSSLNDYDILKQQARLLAVTDKSCYERIDWLRNKLKIGEISVFDDLIRTVYQRFPEDALKELSGCNFSDESSFKTLQKKYN